jgi:hypothetical protein
MTYYEWKREVVDELRKAETDSYEHDDIISKGEEIGRCLNLLSVGEVPSQLHK